MRVLLAVVLIAGCTTPAPAPTVLDGSCAEGPHLTIFAEYSPGLGPEGQIWQPWAGVRIYLEGPENVDTLADSAGCAHLSVSTPGEYVLRADPYTDGCTHAPPVPVTVGPDLAKQSLTVRGDDACA